MKRIDTIAQLRGAWKTLTRLLQRDLVGAGAFAGDPKGLLRRYGYELSPTAESALLAAMP